ncbi:MAG: sigma-54-dependent Fis family transcriptional regulator [Desulfovibrionaceae bacterium]|nr:sigma-54-dependent Fis family transcriptional regulator [Desulfovibrionaceae bacterium]
MEKNAHILLIDDEKNYLLVLETLLEDAGYTVTALNDPETALTFLQESEVDVVLTDMKMPKMTGQDVLEHIKRSWPHIPVVIMTAFGSIESAVEVMKYGAFDYITKPFSNDELILSVHNAVELSFAHQQFRLLQQEMVERYDFHKIIGNSRAIKNVIALVERAAPMRSSVLLSGEKGTGKELVARAIHYGSPRKDKAFVSVNCRALSAKVLESELFGCEEGYADGAVAMRRGRVEKADGGTLFLDEVSELPLDLQVKLVALLQERSFERVGGEEAIGVDVRLLVATTKDLSRLVEEQKFLPDLYYLLNVVTISLPPLRERREDIPLLVAHYVEKVSAENNMPKKSFSSKALKYLTAYEWPGNMRQLENVVEGCLVLVQQTEIDVDDLPSEIQDEEAQFKSAVDLLPFPLDLVDTLEKIEAALVRRALVRADFVQVKAAECLGISKSLFQYKLKKYKITGH